MEVPIIICPTQGVISHFLLAMLEVVQKKQWLVKENLLRFGLDNIMLLRAFPGISLIPVKARYLRQINHSCILSSYTLAASNEDKPIQRDQRNS